MSLQTDLAAAKQAVADLDAKYQSDKAAAETAVLALEGQLASIAPHLSALGEVETLAQQLEAGVVATSADISTTLRTYAAKVRSLFGVDA